MKNIYMVFHVFDMDDFDGVAISAEKPEAAAACGRMWWKRARRKRSPDPPFLSRPACDARMPFGVRVQQN